MEQWKVINEFSLYKISSHGRVFSLISNKILKSTVNKVTGYLRIRLTHNCGKRKTISIHTLVINHFSTQTKSYCVNHKDGNKLNNHISNLEWTTSSENQKHAFKIGLKKNKKSSQHPNSKPIVQKDLQGNIIAIHGSLLEAVSKTHNTNSGCISQCCNKEKYRKTHGGYIWEYM